MKSNVSIAQLEIFAKIAETGGLSAAARELNMTPSAVSKSLLQLEEQIEVLLIKRSTRSVTLTAQGKIFYNRISRILTDIEVALGEIEDLRTQIKGELHISSSVAFGCTQLVSLVSGYRSKYPDVKINISLNDQLVHLGEENIDVALRITNSTDGQYAARKLAEIRWSYCATPKYLEIHGRPLLPSDLTEQMHSFLIYPAMISQSSWTYIDNGIVKYIKVRPALECNSSLALLNLVLMDQGIACLPNYLAREYITKGSLEVILPEFATSSDHTLYAMYFQSRHRNPIIRTFIDYVWHQINQRQNWI